MVGAALAQGNIGGRAAFAVSYTHLDVYKRQVRVLINGLMQQHRSYDAETNGQIDALALRLCDIAEAMKPGRKKKISFEPVEIRVICQCLMEWRNREIQAKRHGAVDAINELLIRFTR